MGILGFWGGKFLTEIFKKPIFNWKGVRFFRKKEKKKFLGGRGFGENQKKIFFNVIGPGKNFSFKFSKKTQKWAFFLKGAKTHFFGKFLS